MTERTLPATALFLSIVTVLGGSAPAFSSGEAATPDEDPGHLEKQEDARVIPSRAERATAEAPPVIRGNFRSIQVNVDALGENILGDAANEPSMAIDPTNPDNIVIGWRQFDTVTSNFRQAGIAYSHDGGETWTFPGVLEPGQFRSDPVLAADTQGVFHYYSLSTTTNAEMFVSVDKGVTWTGPISAFGGDKTWIAADTTGGTGTDHVYAIWNSQFTCCPPNTDFTRTTDGSQSFDGPYAMPSKPKWGTVDVAPDGTVLVVGTRLSSSAYPVPHLLVSSSNAQDATRTPAFDQVSGITLGGETITGGTPNPGGLMGQVWVAADRSGSSTAGNIYVLGSVDPGGSDPLDVMFSRSEDGGATFGAPVRVNGRAPGAWQWFGTMSVAPDGRIDAVWNDTRIDPSGRISELYYAYSTDAGASWSKGLPVTPAYDSGVGYPNQNKMGDYYHMVSEAEGAALAYAATFRGEQDVYFLRVGDCNVNGQHDSKDISGGLSQDCDFNRIPDECQDRVACLSCNDDGVCQEGESCDSCPGDCPAATPGCGNGVCEIASGEDCLSCAADCNGVQGGNPNNRFCCGSGAGTNPVGCGDPRCSEGGLSCVSSPLEPTCCGDGFCDGTETESTCAADCVLGAPGEASDPAVAGGNLQVIGYEKGSGRIDFRYVPACDATQHTIYSGPLSSLSSYDYTSAKCNVGASGSASFIPVSGDLYFLIVGNDTTREGSYGTRSSGAERPEDTATPGCDLPQDLGGVICQ
jgi:hypothetical protein